MATYAVVDAEGNVINSIVWDGESTWTPPEECLAIEDNAGVGWEYDGQDFTDPNAPPPEEPAPGNDEPEPTPPPEQP